MDSFLEMTLMLDYYGQLITKRQFEALDYYYNNDYSLSEISEKLNITRQGVHDTLKKGIRGLKKFENCLKMIEKDTNNNDLLNKIKSNIEKIDIEKLDIDIKEKIENINVLLNRED